MPSWSVPQGDRMINEELERENAELRCQVAFLEAAKAQADQAARKSDMQLVVLLLNLVNKCEICAVMRRDGREWDFHTKEEFRLRDKGDGFVDGVVTQLLPKRKAA